MRRVPSREALTVLAFSGAQLVLGLVGNRVLTQVASPDALGEYYLYLNLVLWLTLPTSSSFLFLWKNWTVARAAGRGADFAGAIARGLGWQALFCALGCAVIGVTGIERGPWPVLVALGIASLGQAINQILDPIQTLERERTLAGLLGLLATPVRFLALAAGLFVLVRESGASLLWVHCVYGIGTAAFSAWLFRRSVRSPYRGDRPPPNAPVESEIGIGRYLRFSLPMLVTGIATQAATSGERWGLALRAAPGATALFVQAVAISLAAINATAVPITTYFTPIISQAAASSPSAPLRAASRPFWGFIATTAFMSGLTAVGVGVLAVPFTTVFFGPRYAAIAALLPWAMAGQGLFALSQAIAMVPVVVEATVGVSVAIVGSKVAYLVLLLALPCSGDCAVWFCKCFAAGNLLYLIGISVVALRAVRRKRGPISAAAAKPNP